MQEKSNKIFLIILSIVAVCSLCLNAWMMMMGRKSQTQNVIVGEMATAYKLYIVIPNEVTDTDSYIHSLETILAGKVPGFTMYPTRGGTLEDDGSMTYQTTLVCELYATDLAVVQDIAREAMRTFGVPTVPIATSQAGWQIVN